MRKLLLPLLAALALCGGSARADDDNYVHKFTGFTFPPKVADFTRKHITPFNAEKSDIEVDYDNDPFTVHLSVYVYPAPAGTPLQQHYEKCKGDVKQVTPAARLVSETPVSIQEAGVRHDGFSALFTLRGKFINNTEQELLSKVILYQRGDYFILYRISYSEIGQEKSEGQIDDFIKQLKWPPEKAAPEAK